MGAVADRVAARVGRADAIGVPMAGEHDRLVGLPRAGQAGDDVVALDPPAGHRQVGGEGRAEVDRAEAGAPRLPLHRLEIEPGAAEQVDRDVALQPALEQHRLRRVRGEHDIDNLSPAGACTVFQP